jgi:DNA-binding response OmpR family regulator
MAEKGVIIVDPDQKHSEALRLILESELYAPVSLGSLSDVRTQLETQRYRALLIDLDQTPLDNRFLKELRKEHPSLCVIGLSNRTFHPDLEEALSRYIDACFAKSGDYGELLYWLKTVFAPSINQRRESEHPG